MKITNTNIISFRMQVCIECKQKKDNILYGDEICHGTNDDIESCIDANLDSMGCDY